MSIPIPTLHSHIGSSWETFWSKRGRNGHDEKLLPVIDVAIKIYEISNLDEKSGRFDCSFVIMLDWIDPSLERNELSNEELRKIHSIDWSLHFVPRIELLDCVSDTVNCNKSALPRIRSRDSNGESNHVTMTIKYSATMKSRFDFRSFPFEKQVLQLCIKCHTVSDGTPFVVRGGGTSEHGLFQFNPPERWRNKQGHVVNADADWLSDWDILGISSGTKSLHTGKTTADSYIVQCHIQRDARSIMFNQSLSLATIDVMALVAYGIQPMELADRASIVLTMMLTAMTFKYVLSSALPSVPYLTTMDRFMISSFCVFAVQIILHWLVAELEVHLCFWDGMDFAYGTVDSGHPNLTYTPEEEGYTKGHAHGIWKGREYPYNPTPDLCRPIHLFDRVQMLTQLVFIMCKYAILVRLYYKSFQPHQNDGTLIDMGALAEFESSDIMQPFDRKEVQLSTIPMERMGGEGGKVGKQEEEEKEEKEEEEEEKEEKEKDNARIPRACDVSILVSEGSSSSENGVVEDEIEREERETLERLYARASPGPAKVSINLADLQTTCEV